MPSTKPCSPAPPSPGLSYPEPPELPPEPVDYDWSIVRQIVAELNRADTATWDKLDRITAPTLLISGSANNDLLEAVRANLPNGQVTEIAVGHHVHQAAHGEYVDALMAFLA